MRRKDKTVDDLSEEEKNEFIHKIVNQCVNLLSYKEGQSHLSGGIRLAEFGLNVSYELIKCGLVDYD